MTIAHYPPLAIGKNAFELFFQVFAGCQPFFFFFFFLCFFFLINSGGAVLERSKISGIHLNNYKNIIDKQNFWMDSRNFASLK
jgi:hypothetical protein